jgi:sugar O-acyltransferase (sialic acid O-acetyltransferase NeuD family)
MKKLAIVGAGGFGREVFHQVIDSGNFAANDITFFVDDIYATENVRPLSALDISEYLVLVAIGDPTVRSNIVNTLPIDTNYYTFVHRSAILTAPDIQIGEGSIICAGCILTTHIELGKHTQLNLHTTIGHDVVAGDFFTTAPGAKISGNCKFGKLVYLGTNCSIREKIQITDQVVIGMGASVIKDITESGVYVGIPAQLRK